MMYFTPTAAGPWLNLQTPEKKVKKQAQKQTGEAENIISWVLRTCTQGVQSLKEVIRHIVVWSAGEGDVYIIAQQLRVHITLDGR